MMQCVYTNVPWSMASLCLRCVEECSHLCKSLTALVPTAPSRRAQTRLPRCVWDSWQQDDWMGERGGSVRLWAGLWSQVSRAQLSSLSARLQWLSMEREQGDRDRSVGGPSVMDCVAESRSRAVTAQASRGGIHSFKMMLHSAAGGHKLYRLLKIWSLKWEKLWNLQNKTPMCRIKTVFKLFLLHLLVTNTVWLFIWISHFLCSQSPPPSSGGVWLV